IVCSQPSVTKRILKELKSWVRRDNYAVVNPKHVYTKKKANLAPGSILVIQRATHLADKIFSVERYEPYIQSRSTSTYARSGSRLIGLRYHYLDGRPARKNHSPKPSVSGCSRQGPL